MGRLITLLGMVWMSCQIALAQTGSIKGFVFDADNGEPVPRMAVLIKGSNQGSATDENGFFSIRHIPAGKHSLEVRNVAYFDDYKIVDLGSGETVTVNFQVRRRIIYISEATISGRKQMYENRVVSSVHRLTPATIERIPSILPKADLAEYLQVIPGIVTTGDRGGQLYIRGGTPVQNLTLLDGMTIINPFHSIGFVSVFDTDILQTVDVYTSGFGARYGGRVSSVIDLKTKAGNRNNYSGSASASTFGYGLLVEGPLRKMTDKSTASSSILISNKRSYLDATQPLLAPFLDSLGMPFSYNDLFGKYSFRNEEGDQIDISMLHFRDRANYEGMMESTWQNSGIRARYLYSPRLSASVWETQVALSEYAGQFTEGDLRPRETRYGSVDVHLANSFSTERMDWRTGFGFCSYATGHEFLGLDSLVVREKLYTMDADMYLETRIHFERWLLEPGLHFRLYTSYFSFFPEPRIRARFSVNEFVSLNFSGGLYSQELMSTMADEDVIKIFQGYKIGVSSVQSHYFGKLDSNRIQQAWHLSGGILWFPSDNLRIQTEIYYKNFFKLLNYNRNRVFPDKQAFKMVDEILRKDYIFEKGRAFGLDVLMDYAKEPWSLWVAYSFGYITRQDEIQTYSPHYDRRHNLNLLAGFTFGAGNKYDLKVRWNIGSGFPFTQTYGIFEDLTLYGQSTRQDVTANGSTGVWYGPLNGGRLPWYHRLDISVHRKWELPGGRSLSGSMGLINAYNRANVFYFDRIKYKRIDQYPIMPGFGLMLSI